LYVVTLRSRVTTISAEIAELAKPSLTGSVRLQADLTCTLLTHLTTINAEIAEIAEL